MPRVWALTGARAGDNDQVIALAEALHIPFEVKQLEYNRLRLLGPRLLGGSLVSLSKASRQEILREPPPDLTISAGHRSVPVVQALRRLSGGCTSSIHVGFPRVSPGKFDLVIATPQYPIANHPNLLRVPYALTRAATLESDPTDRAMLSRLPQPRRLLIVGGQSLYWTIDETALLGTLRELLGEAERSGGSVLVTTSPRTTASLEASIAEMLSRSGAPSVLTAPARSPSYPSLLETADSITVTADSVAMTSDAIWTGKPVAIVPVKKSLFGSIAMGAMDLIRPSSRIYPQDLRFFWKALAEIGISAKLARPKISTEEEIRQVLDRAKSIVDRLRRD